MLILVGGAAPGGNLKIICAARVANPGTMPMKFVSNEQAAFTDLADSPPWVKTFVVLPRVVLKLTRTGAARRLILPGRYESRMSRRLNVRIFRKRAS